MKKNYYLAALTILALQSCKKENKEIFNSNLLRKNSLEVKSDSVANTSFYPLGTVFKVASLKSKGLNSTANTISNPSSKFVANITIYARNENNIRERGNARIVTNNSYHLDFQADGNLVLSKGSEVLWSCAKTTTFNTGTAFDWPTISFLTDGDIVCKDFQGNAYWGAGISYGPNAIWVLQDDANFVGYSDHYIDNNGNIVITGSAIGETATVGGKKSKKFGRLKL